MVGGTAGVRLPGLEGISEAWGAIDVCWPRRTGSRGFFLNLRTGSFSRWRTRRRHARDSKPAPVVIWGGARLLPPRQAHCDLGQVTKPSESASTSVKWGHGAVVSIK